MSSREAQIRGHFGKCVLTPEEMTKLVLESGLVQAREDRYELTGPLPALSIPTPLRDALMARLDLLTTAKAVAALAATLSRTFNYVPPLAASQPDQATAHRELRQP